jgi:hypothetical protein
VGKRWETDRFSTAFPPLFFQPFSKCSHQSPHRKPIQTRSKIASSAASRSSLATRILHRVSAALIRSRPEPSPLVPFYLIAVEDTQEALALRALGIVFEHGVAKAKFDEKMQTISTKIVDVESEMSSIGNQNSDNWIDLQTRKDVLVAAGDDLEKNWNNSVEIFEARRP